MLYRDGPVQTAYNMPREAEAWSVEHRDERMVDGRWTGTSSFSSGRQADKALNRDEPKRKSSQPFNSVTGRTFFH